jgi:murein L,D-transpeptidase YafK
MSDARSDRRFRRALQAALGSLAFAAMSAGAVEVPTSARAERVAEVVAPTLAALYTSAGVRADAALLLRIFKAEQQLEVWADGGERYRLLKSYPICRYSGALGPKLREGDNQAPEGFYAIGAGQLNPMSRFHLAFNLGYPNAFDRAQGRTGAFLMVHGNCVSIGCYAMGDVAIEEIYTLVAQAIARGQKSVPVQVFPFRFDADWRARMADSEWLDFWSQLEAGYRAFEDAGVPPRIRVVEGRYVVGR